MRRRAALIADAEHHGQPTQRGGEGGVEVGRAARYMRELIKKQVNSNHLARAGSITDSSVLRRKGRLKEQDALIEFIVGHEFGNIDAFCRH